VRELWCLFGAWAALTLVASRASAQDRGEFTLDFTAPPGCPTRNDVRARAEALLGGPIEQRLTHTLVVRGTVSDAGGQAELRLHTVDNGIPGERVLSGATCEEVASAAALIIALAIDPKTVAARSNDAPATAGGSTAASSAGPPAPAPAATAAPTPAPANAKTPAEQSKEGHSGAPVTGLVEADLAFDLGALPGLAIGPSLSGGFALGRVRLRIGATYFAPRFAEAVPEPDKPTRGADVSLLVLDAAGCYALTPPAVEVGVCAELEGGALLAVGSGFDHTNDAIKPWLGAGASVDLTVPIAGPVAARAEVGAMVPFGRSSVQFTETTGTDTEAHELHKPGPISGRAAVGVGFAFR
jgi:hypothetical protein